MVFVAKSDVRIWGGTVGTVGKEGRVMVENDVGSAGVGTTFVISLHYREEWVVGLLELLLCKAADGGGNVRQKIGSASGYNRWRGATHKVTRRVRI